MSGPYKTKVKIGQVIWDQLVLDRPVGEFEIATPKERFDFFIKQSFLKGKPYLPGQCIDPLAKNFGFRRGKFIYDRYFSTALNIPSRLHPVIHEKYSHGLGNEFATGKFLSVASSSRFSVSCFTEFVNGVIQPISRINFEGNRDIVTVDFEQELSIRRKNSDLISHPQMDVVLSLDNGDQMFIEAKCHEIFDNHKRIHLKWDYLDSEFIDDIPLDRRGLQRESRIYGESAIDYIGKDGELITADAFNCTLSTHHFDFKQFICHLMGILDRRKESKTKTYFYYLFYRNTEYISADGSKIYDELETELRTIFGIFSKIFPTIHFGYLYSERFDTIWQLKECT